MFFLLENGHLNLLWKIRDTLQTTPVLGVTDITVIIIIVIIMQWGRRTILRSCLLFLKLVKGRCMSADSTKVLVNIKTSFKFKDGPVAIYLKTLVTLSTSVYQTKKLLRIIFFFFNYWTPESVCIYLKEILRFTDFVKIFLEVKSINYSEQAKNRSEDHNLPLTMWYI